MSIDTKQEQITFVPLKTGGGYAKAYDYLLDSDLSDAELRMYLMIMRYGDSSGKRIPLQENLAKRRGVKRQAVSRTISSMVKKGWIQVITEHVPKVDRSCVFATKRNIYTLMVPSTTYKPVTIVEDQENERDNGENTGEASTNEATSRPESKTVQTQLEVGSEVRGGESGMVHGRRTDASTIPEVSNCSNRETQVDQPTPRVLDESSKDERQARTKAHRNTRVGYTQVSRSTTLDSLRAYYSNSTKQGVN